ncbi:MAG: YggT family protein [Candidatus Hydrothermia bacterium]|jgi:YggT family protein|nr:YggT family protein [Candidatus Hydrothermia bacterium]
MENFIALTIDIYCFIIFLSAILSWFDLDRNNDVVRFIDSLSDIVLRPIRNFLFEKLKWSLPIDISPIIAIFLLQLIKAIILKII